MAFIKGALTGNAAQVLWDTDRSATGSLRKLIVVLKSRYSGERQAEKYRAELQIRRCKVQESMSELHQDIRRLTVLAYPKLSADAPEQIGFDHFTNALGDPDFALKVKERAPKSLDEALCIALRLEAWTRSVRQGRHEDDWSDRPKHRVRTAVKSDTIEAVHPDSNDRLTKSEAEMGQLHEKLNRLLESPQLPSRPAASPRTSLADYTDQRPGTQATSSAGEEGPPPQNVRNNGIGQPQRQQAPCGQSQPALCWDCGLPGHMRRN